ncbi:MAG: hypothetical protein MUD06_15490 [Rhodospirillales bacterium]|jgi:hypothetical protein|nr:hypothetical protein [Rhodospirillales bacterium]
MTKVSITSAVVAAAFAIGMSAPGAMAEEQLTPQAKYEQTLNDCQQLDNPDRRQQCRDKAMQQLEQAQKSGMKKNGGMEKQKQY